MNGDDMNSNLAITDFARESAEVLPSGETEKQVRLYSFPNCPATIVVTTDYDAVLDEIRSLRSSFTQDQPKEDKQQADLSRILPEEMVPYILALPLPELVQRIYLLDEQRPDADNSYASACDLDLPNNSMVFYQPMHDQSFFDELIYQWSGILRSMDGYEIYRRMHDLSTAIEQQDTEELFSSQYYWVRDLSKIILSNEDELSELIGTSPISMGALTLALQQVITTPSTFRSNEAVSTITSKVEDATKQCLRKANEQLIERIQSLTPEQNESCNEIRLLVYLAEAQSFSQLSHLTHLDLSYDYFQSRHIQNLVPLINLEHLDLSFNGFLSLDDTDVLGHFAVLHTLNLSHTNLSDRDLATLTCFQTLTELNLDSTRISNRALTWLFNFKSLKTLDLQYTDITPDSIASLQEQLPDCHIIY